MHCDRRSFVRLGAGAVSGLFLDGRAGALPEHPDRKLYRWCPRFPVPTEVWQVPFAGDLEEGMLLETAAGLAARASLRGSWRKLVHEDLPVECYRAWFEQYRTAHHPKLLKLDLDDVVRRLHAAGIVKGYVLYRLEKSDRPLHSPGPLDESANVATALAPWLGAVTASERTAERMEALGLRRLADVRDKTERWCLSESGHPFSRSILGTADPKTRNVRSLMVALGAFVCCARGEVYKQALARCEPDSPVVGWGCEGEDTQTTPSTRAGLFQTATNWCHNLPVFASEGPGEGVDRSRFRQKRVVHWSELGWGDGKHHAALVLSDGDNVQWMMGNFMKGSSEGPSYYGHPGRGRIPFSWGLPVPSLAQLAPRTLAQVLQTATPNDDFILFSGGGYEYPDLYVNARGTRDAIRRHADRLRGYMDLTGIGVLAFNFLKWDSPDAMAACEEFAQHLPGLLGILAFQYYPYSAGDGAIRWVRGAGGDEVPVVSCRLCVWAQTGRPHDTTPAGVAAWLNRMPAAGGQTGDECFSWAMVHAWSRFRKAGPGEPLNAEEAGVSQDKDAPGTARGYSAALWTAERLGAPVKAVTVQELLLRVRMRMRPRMALGAWMHEVAQAVERRGHQGPAVPNLARAQRLLAEVAGNPRAAAECYETLVRAHSQLSRPRPPSR